MNHKRSLSRRELLDQLYRSAGCDHEDDSFADDLNDDGPSQRHPEAPLNDSIELEKKARQKGPSRMTHRERDVEDELVEYLEFLAERKSRQRSSRSQHRNEQQSNAEPGKSNSKERHWASCRPLFAGCALSCLVTVGLVKGPEFQPAITALFTPSQAQSQPAPATPVSSTPLQTNPFETTRPMVKDRSNSMERVAGLSASKSTLTGFADSESMTAAYYWTLQISNTGGENQEARMRIALPPGVTLSRATLWVNGVPQEAAFSTTEQVTAAYTWVRDGREQRRFLSHDPLVITQERPGHLLVKAAPIVPGGQPLQLRLGFTSPLHPLSSEAASMRLPQIQESNFEVSGKQDVHLQSGTSIWSNESEVTAIPALGGFLLRGNVQGDSLRALRVNVARVASEQFATRAVHSPAGTFIVASIKPDSNGHMNLSLLRTSNRPNCKIINSEAAAVRLSTLWAYGQVEANVKRGDSFSANELARIFRVVSSVSGATVLEQDSDYAMQGLSRDQFATYDHAKMRARGGDADGFDSAAGAGPQPRAGFHRAVQHQAVAPSQTEAVATPAPSPSMIPQMAPSVPHQPMAHSALATPISRTLDLSQTKSSSTDEVLILDDQSAEPAPAPINVSVPQVQGQNSISQFLLPMALIVGLLLAFRKVPLAQKLLAKLKLSP